MTPLWIFTLGKTIFDRGNLKVPYFQIAGSVFSLIIPLFIGLLIQRKCPRVSRFLVRILKTCSSLLILFIVIFAIGTNLYLFKLFTWEVSSFKIEMKSFERKIMNKMFADLFGWAVTAMAGLLCWMVSSTIMPTRVRRSFGHLH